MRKKTGFSLVEIMVVMAIIGIVAVAGVAEVVRRKPKADLNRATWEIMAQLRRARIQAVSHNATCEIEFDTTDNTCTTWIDLDKDGVADTDEQTVVDLSDINGLYMREFPPTSSSFDSRGNYDNGSNDRDDQYVYFSVPDAGGMFIAIFPSGHVDIWNK